MAETHVGMHLVALLIAFWWTKNWLMEPIIAKWRFTVAALAGTILWIWLAFASTRVVAASGGVQLVYGSTALAYVCGFMALVSVVGLILGLLLWTEEEAEQAARNAPVEALSGIRPGEGR